MNDTGPDRTERELREALATLADGVHAAPDAYRAASGCAANAGAGSCSPR